MTSQLSVLGLLASFCAMCSGCLAQGVVRTPLEDWTERSFEDIGISLSLPKQAILAGTLGVEKWKQNNTGWRSLTFYLHTVEPGKPMVEPLYLIHFRFERLDASQYAAFQKGTHSLAFYWIWKDRHSSEMTNTVHFVWRDLNRDVLGWRQDYRTTNGDVIVAGVEYIPVNADPATVAIDTNAITRVLKSVIIDKGK